MNVLIYIFLTIISFFGYAVLLRFFMQYYRVNFYNVVAQSFVKLTNPVIIPLRRVLPSVFGLDTSTLFVAYLISAILVLTKNGLWGSAFTASFPLLMITFILQVISLILSLFVVLIFLKIILGFLMMGQSSYSPNPFVELTEELTAPILKPFRKLIPPVGVLDFSAIVPIFLSILIQRVLLEAAFIIAPGTYLY